MANTSAIWQQAAQRYLCSEDRGVERKSAGRGSSLKGRDWKLGPSSLRPRVELFLFFFKNLKQQWLLAF